MIQFSTCQISFSLPHYMHGLIDTCIDIQSCKIKVNRFAKECLLYGNYLGVNVLFQGSQKFLLIGLSFGFICQLTRKIQKPKEKQYLIVIPEMTDLDMFFHVHMVKVLSHPTHITPVEIPFAFPISQLFTALKCPISFNFLEFQLCCARKYPYQPH